MRIAIRWLFPKPGALTPLVGSSVVLGRGDDCATQLPGSKTSRHHATVSKKGVIWVLRDLDSTNGVYVNGERIAEHALSVGDLLRLGEWLGVVVGDGSGDDAASSFFREVAPRLWAGPVLQGVFEIARRVAGSDLPIVLEGETGSGKERFAEAIHGESGRSGDLVAVNCAALPDAMAEAELFGYRAGAFTGAVRSSTGFLRSADRGTLLLDEITDLPLSVQAKLLRALELREVVPLGENRPVKVDVRVLAATQKSLPEAVEAGAFRADLFARLDGVTLRIPALRERIEEVPPLFLAFLHDHSGGITPAIDVQLVEQLCRYAWPYNVRELELTARRLLTLHGHRSKLSKRHLPESVLATRRRDHETVRAGEPQSFTGAAQSDARQLKRLVAALEASAGNLARATASLGISRQRAYRLLRTHGVDVARFRRAVPAQESR